MNDDFIMPVIKSSINILKELTSIDISAGEVFERKSSSYEKNIFVLVGICGKVRGHAVFSMDEPLACEIASAIAYERIDKIHDELSRSALAEMGNMIMGNSLDGFYKNGYEIDITPPTVIIGEKVQLGFDKTKIISVQLTAETGDTMEISISYVE